MVQRIGHEQPDMCAGLFSAGLHALLWGPKGLFTPMVLGRVTKTWGVGGGGQRSESAFYCMLLALILSCFQTDAKDTDFQGVGTKWKAASNTLLSMPCLTPISSQPGIQMRIPV